MNDMKGLPRSVLFVCYLNAVRSPIAEGLMKKHFGKTIYASSCGLETGEIDELMVAIMKEAGVDMSSHEPQSLQDLHDSLFDVVIAFTPEAGEAAKVAFHDSDTIVEVWPLPEPGGAALDVRAIMNNYRALRSNLEHRLLKRFSNLRVASL